MTMGKKVLTTDYQMTSVPTKREIQEYLFSHLKAQNDDMVSSFKNFSLLLLMTQCMLDHLFLARISCLV